MVISEQGPQGPVSPITQKLSLAEKRRTRSGEAPVSTHSRSASSSAGTSTVLPSAALKLPPSKTVNQSRSTGRASSSVRNSQARRDRLALEIVAEGEVAEHLEEGVVAGRGADLLQVVVLAGDAQDLLGGGGAAVGACLQAEEGVLERDHPGVGEQQGGVAAGDQRCAGHLGVAVADEVVQEGAARLPRGELSHGDISLHLCGEWWNHDTPRVRAATRMHAPDPCCVGAGHCAIAWH